MNNFGLNDLIPFTIISGFVYYEGDCFMGLKNPYIPLTVKNPTLAQKLQKNLSGHGLQVFDKYQK